MFGIHNQFLDELPEKEVLEQSVIVRLPQHLADQVTEASKSGNSDVLKHIAVVPVSVGLDPWNGVNYAIIFNEEVYLATMHTLPALVESHKTFDNQTYYKTGEISQVLVVEQNPSRFRPEELMQRVPKNMALPDGLTPVTKNAVQKLYDTQTFDPALISAAQMEVLNIMEGKKCTNEFQVISINNPDYKLSHDSPLNPFMASQVSFPNQVGMVSPLIEDDDRDGWNEEKEKSFAFESLRVIEPVKPKERRPNDKLITLREKIKELQNELDKAKNPILKNKAAAKLNEAQELYRVESEKSENYIEVD